MSEFFVQTKCRYIYSYSSKKFSPNHLFKFLPQLHSYPLSVIPSQPLSPKTLLSCVHCKLLIRISVFMLFLFLFSIQTPTHRSGKFDPFTYKWVDLKCILSPTGQKGKTIKFIQKGKLVVNVESHQSVLKYLKPSKLLY